MLYELFDVLNRAERYAYGQLARQYVLEDRVAGLHKKCRAIGACRQPGGTRGRPSGRLLCYIYRHPFRLEGITYDEERGKVVYQARRAHGLKGTDTQEFDPVEFIGVLARHIPPLNKHQVRYYGAAHRDFRAARGDGWTSPGVAEAGEAPEVGRASWAKLMWRIYGVEPLICPHCGKRMRIISIVVHDPVVPKILSHLKLPIELPVLAPSRRSGRGPPEEDEATATSCPEERWYVDEAPKSEDYFTDGAGGTAIRWEEPAFGAEQET